ncbi:MAG TPA: hypothetical protein VFT95_12275 [Micromonosporaceae bacterium]|nr:hypothetical protein [Micromonosporaceae bacterium]
MHLHELLAVLGDVREVVEVASPEVDDDLAGLLRLPDGINWRRAEPADAGKLDLEDGGLVAGVLGPDRFDPDELAPALGALPVGGTVLLVLGWPILDLPYHRLLGPFGAASCQVVDAIPLEGAAVTAGLHAALVVRRVDRLAAPRPYIVGLGNGRDAEVEPAAELRTALRIANEHALGELVTRPLRLRMADLERDLAARESRLAETQRSLARAQAKIVRMEARLAELRGSATFRVGQAVVKGARNPARAVVAVPRDLARIWRDRGTRHGRPAPGGAPATE